MEFEFNGAKGSMGGGFGSTGLIIGIVFGLIVVAAIVISIVFAVRHAKRISKVGHAIEDVIIDKLKNTQNKINNPAGYIICEYCGSANEKTNKSCSNCGAGLNHSKK